MVAHAEHALGVMVTKHDPHTGGHDVRSRYQGYWRPSDRLIFVKRAASTQMLKTLIHELGHALDDELRTASREEQETVAEAVAYMVCAHAGIDTGSYSFPYIASWAGQEQGSAILRRVLDRTQRIAAQLIDALTVGDPGAEQPQQARAAVQVTVADILDRLPSAYTSTVYQQKCDQVYQHIYESYSGRGRSIYQPTA